MGRDQAEPMRFRGTAACVAALPALMLFATPATAQYGAPAPQAVPDAQPRPDNPESPAPAGQTQLLQAAACLVGRDANAGSALLAAAPFSADERQEAVRTLRAAERCVGSRARLATSPMLLRGALAEALYEARFPQPPPARTPPLRALASLPADAAAARQDIAPAFALADCAAGRGGETVRALLAAEPDTDAEGVALQALNPVFAACVAPGTSLSVDRAGLRSLLAQSLYRWAVVQRDGAASPWAVQVRN